MRLRPHSWLCAVLLAIVVLTVSLSSPLQGQAKVGQCLGGAFRLVVGESCQNKQIHCLLNICIPVDNSKYYKWDKAILAGSCGRTTGVCQECTGQLVVCTGEYYLDDQCVYSTGELLHRDLPKGCN
jgi:hypothetical protein